MSDKPPVSGEEVAKHTTRETGVWVIVHGAYRLIKYTSCQPTICDYELMHVLLLLLRYLYLSSVC